MNYFAFRLSFVNLAVGDQPVQCLVPTISTGACLLVCAMPDPKHEHDAFLPSFPSFLLLRCAAGMRCSGQAVVQWKILRSSLLEIVFDVCMYLYHYDFIR